MKEVKDYYEKCNSLKKVLEKDIYLNSYFENENKKNLILKISAFFERKFEKVMKNILHPSTHDFIKNFVYKECLDRKFYKIFNFDINKPRNGANSFFNKFGTAFSDRIKNKIKAKELENSIAEFILLVKERNLIIHTSETSITDSFTIEEIYLKFLEANKFLDFLDDEFQELSCLK
ncbi:MAG: hypothetical protein ACRC5W_10420 [Cetobacterium sp.]